MSLQKGDVVECIANHYISYSRGERAVVLEVKNHLITLVNPYCDYGKSDYASENWKFISRPERNKQIMATEKTKYFGVRLDTSVTGSEFLLLTDQVTVPYDTPNEVEKVINPYVAQGESWIILKTVALVEPVTSVPTKATYYK